METDFICSDDMEGFVDESSEQLNSPHSLYLNGIYGESEVLPRVGDQYQAEIPECDRSKLVNCSANSELELHLQNPNSLGLPIPLMWTRSEKFNGFHEAESGKETPITSNNENTGPKPKTGPAARSKVRVVVLALPCQKNPKKFKLNRLEKSLCPFPGSLGVSWEDAEHDRFLLGLYILGKNLSAVKRLVESKNMEDILCYYYGKFYRSSEYGRWAEGRRFRSRRSVQGQKLLTGWRQMELLSRISHNVSEECKSMLLEVSRTFREEKISLEAYLITLKSAVGISTLIEAIGIGKGKKDLTSATMEPPKKNLVSANSEVPTGKTFSSLSSADIIKLLTGGFRLSKARSSDLFWEAVWPRLLARGWHSEQPKDHARNSLVFLIPGVKKFSRRRLVKGNHYFDSVSDVLNKAASEPGLLELETEETKENGNNEENEMDPSIKDDEPDSSAALKRHRYLQPCGINQNGDTMKFTIVDTSMAHGSEKRRVSELRSLPFENASASTISSSFSSELEHNTSEESGNEADEVTNTSKATRACDDSSVCENGTVNADNNKSIDVEAENNASQSTVSLDENRGKDRKVKPGNTKYLSIGIKRNGLTASANGESTCRIETASGQKKPKNKESHLRSNSPDAFDMMGEYKDKTQKLSSVSSLAEGSSNGRKEGATSLEREVYPEKPGHCEEFDLNVSPEFEPDETIITHTVQNNGSSCTGQSSVQVEMSMQCKPEELPNGEASADQQTNRRQSTRNRPLTTKALEAFAFGFLGSPKKKRKDPERSGNNSRPQSSKRVRGGTVVFAEYRNGTGVGASNPNETG